MSKRSMKHYNELYHHGIKGQKWGVRRYRNEDGTLTAAGRARYYSSDGSPSKKIRSESKKLFKALEAKWSGPMPNKEAVEKKVVNELMHNKAFVIASQKSTAAHKWLSKHEDEQYTYESDGTPLDFKPSKEYWEKRRVLTNNTKIAVKITESVNKKYKLEYDEALLKDVGYPSLELGPVLLEDIRQRHGIKGRKYIFDSLWLATELNDYSYEWNKWV